MRVGMVSISDCVSASVTAGAIYMEAMKVLLHHSVDSLIVAFARTPLFKNEFRSFYINDIGRLGQSSVFRELGEEGRNDFFEEVYKRFLARTALYFAEYHNILFLQSIWCGGWHRLPPPYQAPSSGKPLSR